MITLRTSRMIIIIIIGALLFSSCSYFSSYGRAQVRAKRAYKAGDYDTAVRECVRALTKNPGYEKSLKLLDDVFPKAIEFHFYRINRLEISQEPFRWDEIVNEYETILELTSLLEELSLPQTEVLLFRSGVNGLQLRLDDARQNAAESHYTRGVELMQRETRENYKLAANEFKKAMEFSPGYADSETLYEECRQQAITRIALMSFENSTGTSRYGDIGELISNEILSTMMQDESLMEFVEFVNRDKIKVILDEQQLAQSGLVDEESSIEIGNILGVHLIITGKVTHISAGEPQHIRNRRRMEKKIVTGQETYTNSEGKERIRNIYATVYANVVFHEVSAESMVTVSYQILDVSTTKILYSNNLSAKYKYSQEWVTYSGDKRALSFSARLLAKRREQPIPDKMNLIMEAVKKLSSRMEDDIKNALK